jgi:hypothetical protein
MSAQMWKVTPQVSNDHTRYLESEECCFKCTVDGAPRSENWTSGYGLTSLWWMCNRPYLEDGGRGAAVSFFLSWGDKSPAVRFNPHSFPPTLSTALDVRGRKRRTDISLTKIFSTSSIVFSVRSFSWFAVISSCPKKRDNWTFSLFSARRILLRSLNSSDFTFTRRLKIGNKYFVGVMALWYNPEDGGFDSLWDHRIFQLT